MARIIHPSTGKPAKSNGNGKDDELKQATQVFEDIRIFAIAMVQEEHMRPGVVLAGVEQAYIALKTSYEATLQEGKKEKPKNGTLDDSPPVHPSK